MTNVTVNAQGLELSGKQIAKIGDTIARALQRFPDQVGNVTVYVRDINGPRGGHDISVVVRARMRGRMELTVSALRPSLGAALLVAARKTRRRVKRQVNRLRRFERSSIGQLYA